MPNTAYSNPDDEARIARIFMAFMARVRAGGVPTLPGDVAKPAPSNVLDLTAWRRQRPAPRRDGPRFS